MARNFGIEKASGDFIYFVDSDDTLETSKLPKLFKILTENRNIEIFCFNHNLLYENGNSKSVNTFKFQEQIESNLFFENYLFVVS